MYHLAMAMVVYGPKMPITGNGFHGNSFYADNQSSATIAVVLLSNQMEAVMKLWV